MLTKPHTTLYTPQSSTPSALRSTRVVYSVIHSTITIRIDINMELRAMRLFADVLFDSTICSYVYVSLDPHQQIIVRTPLAPERNEELFIYEC